MAVFFVFFCFETVCLNYKTGTVLTQSVCYVSLESVYKQSLACNVSVLSVHRLCKKISLRLSFVFYGLLFDNNSDLK